MELVNFCRLDKRLAKPVSPLHTVAGSSDLLGKCLREVFLYLSEAHQHEATLRMFLLSELSQAWVVSRL